MSENMRTTLLRSEQLSSGSVQAFKPSTSCVDKGVSDRGPPDVWSVYAALWWEHPELSSVIPAGAHGPVAREPCPRGRR